MFSSLSKPAEDDVVVRCSQFVSAGGEFVIAKTWAITDVGKVRPTNQDCHFVDPEKGLVLVFDGMGGHRAGEVASLIAMETMSTFCREHWTKPSQTAEFFENYDANFTYETNLLRQAVFDANRAVLDQARARDDCLGMGSTVAGLVIHNHTVSMVNVGDSRMYLIRNGGIEQISKDHTLAEDQVERGMMTREEARDSQLNHILSSVIGVDGKIRVHMDELVVIPGDIVLLCTDGLTAVMDDNEILDWIVRNEPGSELLSRMVEEVNARGGPDNTTLAITVFGEDPDSSNLG